ncbi:tyrosine-type recombinase/integrase [Allobranchiibius sp. CTAmp26]|uniref:tyrosine-type recombinase/integrase n=1 Tax=Allobranchiibius sp. CTAmp26 TaxID=2815214 RepID=UPI001AA12725|nr:tyrosine-type recombinase/integrase [Allobranchiibius sp. CTAmp26]MBO1756481.1 hypothetical protein [Allobranchiibius sp. CTAmp26]
MRWQAWCDRTGFVSFPAVAADVAAYLQEASRVERPGGVGPYAASTLSRWVAGIDAVHRAASDERPELVVPGQTVLVRRTLSAIRRRRAADRSTPARKQACPLSRSDLVAMMHRMDMCHWPAGVAARRDAAVLLVGWVGARRSGEIANIRVHDVTWCVDHVQVRIPVSKTDQGGQGHTVVLPRADLEPALCAPCALHRWITLRCAIWAAGHPPPGVDETLLAPSTVARHRGARETTAAMSVVLAWQPTTNTPVHVCGTPPGTGPIRSEAIPLESRLPGHGADRLFTAVHRTGRLSDRMSSEVVTDIVTRARRAADLPTEGYSSHSLRAGFVTTADKGGADIMAIQQQTAHRTHESVAVYRRRNNPSDGNAVHALGL